MEIHIKIADAQEYIPDLSKSNIHCSHISDSILFWTEGTSKEDFENIVNCAAFFLNRSLQATFPLRGCVVAGKFTFEPSTIENDKGFVFQNSLLYGKALVDAYLKAESQDWAGCYIDKSALLKVDPSVITKCIDTNIASYYSVPLKDDKYADELAIRTIQCSINNTYFTNLSKTFEEIFMIHMNGKPMNESAKRKLVNTIKFLSCFRED